MTYKNFNIPDKEIDKIQQISYTFFKTTNIIPFNKSFLTGKEAHYMYQAVYAGKLSGNGVFTKKCQKYFEDRYGFRKAILTTSGTDAL